MIPMVMSVLYVWAQMNRDMIVSFWFGTRFKVEILFCIYFIYKKDIKAFWHLYQIFAGLLSPLGHPGIQLHRQWLVRTFSFYLWAFCQTGLWGWISSYGKGPLLCWDHPHVSCSVRETSGSGWRTVNENLRKRSDLGSVWMLYTHAVFILISPQGCEWADWKFSGTSLLLPDVQISRGPGRQIVPVHSTDAVSIDKIRFYSATVSFTVQQHHICRWNKSILLLMSFKTRQTSVT